MAGKLPSEYAVPADQNNSPLAALGGVGTVAAAVSIGTMHFLASNRNEFVAAIPVAAYLALVGTALYLGGQRGERIRHGFFLLGSVSLLCFLLPFCGISKIELPLYNPVYVFLTVAALPIVALRFIWLFLRGRDTAVSDGIFAVLATAGAAFITAFFAAVMISLGTPPPP
jgi:hypothetical protein